MNPASLVRARDSLVPALLNGLINGAIAHLSLRSAGSVPLSLDLISTRQNTVWGQGVTLAFALGVILSLVTASALVGGLAAVITVLVEVRTKRAMLRPGCAGS